MNVWFLSERQFISPSSASMRVTLDVCRPLFESFEFVLICNWERMRSRRPTNTFYTTPAGVSTRFLSVEFTYFTFGENLSPVRIKNYTQQLASCGPKSPRWLAKGGVQSAWTVTLNRKSDNLLCPYFTIKRRNLIWSVFLVYMNSERAREENFK